MGYKNDELGFKYVPTSPLEAAPTLPTAEEFAQKESRIAADSQVYEALKAVEWVWSQNPFGYWCIGYCGRNKNLGHTDDCIVGNAIKAYEGGQ